MMKKNISAIFCLFMLGAGLCLAQSEQPSLAEMAKRNKTKSKPVKTFTEADLPSKGLATDTAAAPATQKTSNETTTAAAVASDGKKAGSKETSPGPKDAPAVAQLKKQIETYRDQRDSWQSSANRYEALLANETDDFRRQTYTEAIENDKKNATFYQGKLGQAESELVNQQKTTPSGSSGGASAQP
jgi:hypothetical protein